MIESERVITFVFDALLADSAFASAIGGRLYRDQVPQAVALPAGIVRLVSATDVATLGASRVWSNVLVDVHLIAQGASYGPIKSAADRADVVLQQRSGAAGGAQIVELRREQIQAFVLPEAGISYAHLITSWRTEAYASA